MEGVNSQRGRVGGGAHLVDCLSIVHEALVLSPALRILGITYRQKDQEFQVILGDIVSLRTTWDIKDSVLRKEASEMR